MAEAEEFEEGYVHDLDAERVVLGALLWDNANYQRIPGSFRPSEFFAPIHAMIFSTIRAMIVQGQLAEPVLVMQVLSDDEAFIEAGGVRYLAELCDAGQSDRTGTYDVAEYAEYVSKAARARDALTLSYRRAQF